MSQIIIMILVFLAGFTAGAILFYSSPDKTFDDPTGEKKKKIYDTLNSAIEDIKSIV